MPSHWTGLYRPCQAPVMLRVSPCARAHADGQSLLRAADGRPLQRGQPARVRLTSGRCHRALSSPPPLIHRPPRRDPNRPVHYVKSQPASQYQLRINVEAPSAATLPVLPQRGAAEIRRSSITERTAARSFSD